MALIVEYHVIADMYTVGTTAISAGMLVSFDANSAIVPSPINTDLAVGIAGDSALAAAGQTTAYSAQVTIGADGANNRWTENRVSDFYDETAASNKITIYNGGGKFWISSDLLDAGTTLAAGEFMRVGAATAGEWLDGGTNAVGDTVAIAAGASQAYPSGVPGTAVDGSISLGNYFPVILRI